jgi:hypothetical protein
MRHLCAFSTARNVRAVCILALLFAFLAGAYAVDGATSGGNVPHPMPAVNASASAVVKAAPKPITKPLWSELTPMQQQALAPLSTEWDKLEPVRKKKWLQIGNKYTSMKPDEQQRVQERIREWVKLTPEQRRVARESYARAKNLNPDQKSAHWQQYQQLPEEQKKKLATDDAPKKHVANLPTAHSKNKAVPPIKSTPKPILEQSVAPQATPLPNTQPAQTSISK